MALVSASTLLQLAPSCEALTRRPEGSICTSDRTAGRQSFTFLHLLQAIMQERQPGIGAAQAAGRRQPQQSLEALHQVLALAKCREQQLPAPQHLPPQ